MHEVAQTLNIVAPGAEERNPFPSHRAALKSNESSSHLGKRLRLLFRLK